MRDAGEAARNEKRDELVHALDECRLRPEAAQLARDPPRQQEIEERAVEHARAGETSRKRSSCVGQPAGAAASTR